MITHKTFEEGKGVWHNGQLTICEAHRQIYDILIMHFQDSPHLERILELLAGAFNSGTSMCNALILNKLDITTANLKDVENDSVESKRLRKLRIQLTALSKELETCPSL